MKKFISLIFVSFLISCADYKAMSVTNSFGSAARNLPACQGKEITLWNECNGVIINMSDGKVMYHSSGGYLNGKRHGYNYESYLGKSCVSTMINGKKEGWEICKKENTETVISKTYFKNGIESSEDGERISKESHIKECLSIGFKENTPEFGMCILKLREIENAKINNSPVSSNTENKSPPSDTEKLNALNMLLQGVQQVTGTGQNNSSSTKGVICTKVSEQRNGIYKSCSYNCAGTTASTTVRSVDSCPSNTNF